VSRSVNGGAASWPGIPISLSAVAAAWRTFWSHRVRAFDHGGDVRRQQADQPRHRIRGWPTDPSQNRCNVKPPHGAVPRRKQVALVWHGRLGAKPTLGFVTEQLRIVEGSDQIRHCGCPHFGQSVFSRRVWSGGPRQITNPGADLLAFVNGFFGGKGAWNDHERRDDAHKTHEKPFLHADAHRISPGPNFDAQHVVSVGRDGFHSVPD